MFGVIMAVQGEGKIFTLYRCKDNDEWLKIRKQGIGGSDVAAIMGLSPWGSPYKVWADKVLDISENISGKPAVQWGNILEPVVGNHYQELHKDRKIRRLNAVCRSIARPWAQASLDYEIEDKDLGWGILEIKTAGLRSADKWDDGVPLFYQTQITHYMSVTGRTFADVAVLIGGSDYREYRILRDENDIKVVNEYVDNFWHENVENGIEPDVIGIDNSVLFQGHKSSDGEMIIADSHLDNLISLWQSYKDQDKTIVSKEKEIEAKIKQAIGNARGVDSSIGKVTWIRSKSNRLDTKALKEKYPNLVETFSKTVDRDGGLRFNGKKEIK